MLSRISVSDIRCFSQFDLELSQFTVLFGQNGVGKTSLIEAIFLLGVGESFRAGKIDEVIKLGKELGRVEGWVVADDEEEKLEVMITHGVVAGRRTQSRLFSLNGARKRRKDFIGNAPAVVFRPEDMRLVEGSPSRRRQFLDTALSAVSQVYARSVTAYEQTLLRRNRLLQLIRDGRQSSSSLTYWNLALVKHGEIVQAERAQLVKFLNTVPFGFQLELVYVPSVINADELAQRSVAETAAGHTLIGPHKDDLVVNCQKLVGEKTEWVNIVAYGSRGQQRLAVLWLKLGELMFLAQKTQAQPMLLLDDIMSELDQSGRDIVWELVRQHQTVLTTADKDLVSWIKSHSKLISVATMIELPSQTDVISQNLS